jgi:hypothetical protein
MGEGNPFHIVYENVGFDMVCEIEDALFWHDDYSLEICSQIEEDLENV